MPLRCPVCKVENETGPGCRRCKADLSMLFGLESQRSHLLAQTRQELHSGRWLQARQLAAKANSLREDRESLRLIALASLLSGDHHDAWRIYLKLSGRSES